MHHARELRTVNCGQYYGTTVNASTLPVYQHDKEKKSTENQSLSMVGK